MGFSKMSKRASSAPQKSTITQTKAPAPAPAVLTMGISPAAAVATWRLAESKLFECYTYWPVQEVVFQSEVFGKNQAFAANHFNLNDASPLPSGQPLAAVILVVPSIKDVARMCKKLKPVLSNSTLVLVDICGGLAPLQRLVRTNLGSSFQVSGFISDVDAEFVSKSSDSWQVLHRAASTVPPAATTASQSLITMEPCQPLLRTILSLEEAWAAGGLSSTHLKSTAMFSEFQWNRCITTVVFEVLTVVLDSPDPSSIAQSVVAKPLVEGLITEMNMVAAACGCTGLQSKAQMLTNGPRLARRAPASFAEPGFSRTYYEVYNHLPVPLDFLVLLPILLSDELPKGGYTPYLECVYAFMSRLLQLNNGEYSSFLLERVGSGTGSSAKGGAVSPEVLAALEAREAQVKQREQQLTSFGQTRAAEIEQSQQQLRQQQQQLAEERAQHERAKQELEPRYRSQVEGLQAQIQQYQQQLQRHQAQYQQLQQQHQQLQQRQLQPAASRGVDPAAVAGSGDPNVVEGLQKLRIREQELSQREEKLKRDQQLMYQQQQQQQQQQTPPIQQQQYVNGGATAVTASTSPSVTAQAPSTPGGTTYSRFDPRAPQPSHPAAAPVQQQLPQQYQAVDPLDTSFNSADSRGSRPPTNNGFYASGASQTNSRSQVMMPPPPAANTPYFQPNGFPQQQYPQYMPPVQGQYVAQTPPPQGTPQQFRRRPQSRRTSMGDESEIMSVASNTNRRRQPATQSALFSQNFQLDGVMNSATDRYHFVGRNKGKQTRDPKLSSDENAYHHARKFIHGGGISGSYPNLAASGIPEAARRKSSFQPNGSIVPSASTNGMASNGAAHRPMANSSSSIKNSVSSPSVPQVLIPPNVVPNSQSSNNFGFNFGGAHESFDDAQHQMPSLDPAARGDGYGSFPGSNNSSSMESNHASDRSDTRTPPTPQGTLDPLKKNNAETLQEETDKGRNWGKRLFKMN